MAFIPPRARGACRCPGSSRGVGCTLWTEVRASEDVALCPPSQLGAGLEAAGEGPAARAQGCLQPLG